MVVITKQEHDCCRKGCNGKIPANSKAEKVSRIAETYRERCHADRHGKVSWYFHPECSARVVLTK